MPTRRLRGLPEKAEALRYAGSAIAHSPEVAPSPRLRASCRTTHALLPFSSRSQRPSNQYACPYYLAFHMLTVVRRRSSCVGRCLDNPLDRGSVLSPLVCGCPLLGALLPSFGSSGALQVSTSRHR